MTLKDINKLWQFFRYFILARKAWRWPRQSDVLILDAAGQEFLLEYLQPRKPEVLYVRGEQINMRVLWASLFRSGKKSDAYLDCFIERVRPRLILTLIDNNAKFYSLAVRHQNIKTLFVQNGFRGYYLDVFEYLYGMKPSKDGLKVNYMMTFGSRIGAEYAQYIQGTVVPMGSLKNNRFPKGHSKKAGTIAFVSQYRNTRGLMMGGKFYNRSLVFEQTDRLVLTFLAKYSTLHGKEMVIVPCSGYYKDGTLEKEKEYYNKLLGQTCVFSDWRWLGSSYDAADTAEVVVSIDCTLGYESAARGNRTAIFSIRSELLGIPGCTYGWPATYPDEGPFWTNRSDIVAFERILDHLFVINDEQWQIELSQSGFADIMIYDPGNSILQSVLNSELGALPRAGNRS